MNREASDSGREQQMSVQESCTFLVIKEGDTEWCGHRGWGVEKN